MTNEQDSVRVAMEGILRFLYAWNSAPIPEVPTSLIALSPSAKNFKSLLIFWPNNTFS